MSSTSSANLWSRRFPTIAMMRCSYSCWDAKELRGGGMAASEMESSRIPTCPRSLRRRQSWARVPPEYRADPLEVTRDKSAAHERHGFHHDSPEEWRGR